MCKDNHIRISLQFSAHPIFVLLLILLGDANGVVLPNLDLDLIGSNFEVLLQEIALGLDMVPDKGLSSQLKVKSNLGNSTFNTLQQHP